MAKPTDKEIRAKIIKRGPEYLTDTELLSVILHEGKDSITAFELAERIMAEVDNNLSRLSRHDKTKLRQMAGMGAKKAAFVSASLELARRLSNEREDIPTVIETGKDVLDLFGPILAGLKHEEFWVILLSKSNSVIDLRKISQGGADGTAVDHKLILKNTVEALASSIILVHNHPSGIANPSDEDMELTRKIIDSAQLFDIEVLDHIIISPGGHYSFREDGLIR